MAKKEVVVFPRRSTDRELIEGQRLTSDDEDALFLLSGLIENVVRSEEFETLVRQNKWTTSFGHCAVASCALQILAWRVYAIYVDTYNAVLPQGCEFTHWFICDPQRELRIDPTAYQFEEYEGDIGEELYREGVRRGHPSRRLKAPYFTNSPPVIYVIDEVAKILGVTGLFRNQE